MPKNRKHKKGKKKSSSSSSSSSRSSSSSSRSVPISYVSKKSKTKSGSKSNSISISLAKQIEKIAFRNDLYSENEKNINNNYQMNPKSQELTKCYICLNASIDPVICRFCGNIACRSCTQNWMKTDSKCGCCRKYLNSDDLISPPIIKNLNKYLNEFQYQIGHETCKIHNEKILFFCMNCLQKYCGKCLYFGSEEAKKHMDHNILDYSEIKNSKYNDIINKLESCKDIKDNIKNEINKNENFKEEIKAVYENSKMALKYFQKIIENKLQNKINIITKDSIILKDTNDDLDKNYNDAITNLHKLEKIEQNLENFDVEKSKNELTINMDKIKTVIKNMNDTQRKEPIIEFKLDYFTMIKHYNEILNSKEKLEAINLPIHITIQVFDKTSKEKEEKIVNILIKNDKNNKSIFIFPLLKLNNKIYNFNVVENINYNINNFSDKDIKINNFEIEQKNEFEDDKNKIYNVDIPLDELSKDYNIFIFSYYIFSIS